MKEKLVFNICLDPEKSLVENLENEVKDCETMIDIFTIRCSNDDVKAYSLRKEYLLSLINEVKND